MDRRQLITRLPFFGAAVALPLPALADLGPQENPELVELGLEFERRFASHAAAKTIKTDARIRYDAIAPKLPGEVTIDGYSDQQLYGHGEPMIDIHNQTVYIGNRRVWVMRCDELAKKLASARPRSSYHRDVRRRLQFLRGYEASVAAAMETSGLKDATEVRYWAADELRRTIDDIVEAEARTTVGLRLKAKALVVARGLEDWHGNIYYAGPLLAEAVMAVLGGEVR